MATTKDLDLSGIPSPATSSSTSRNSQEEKETVPQQEMEDAPITEHPKPAESPRSSQGERNDDLLFQDPQDMQPAVGSLQNPFALYDTDINMSEYISVPADAEVEDMLLSMIRSNEESYFVDTRQGIQSSITRRRIDNPCGNGLSIF